MSYSSVLQWADGLGTGSVLRGGRGTVVGLLATIAFVAVCLGVYVPAVVGFARGNFYQSQFESNARYIDRFYSGQDFKIAMVFRDRQTGLPINHTQLLNLLEILVVGSNIDGIYNEPLLPCDRDYFQGDLHAPTLTDCLIIPPSIEFTAGWEFYYSFGFLKLIINPPVSSNPFQSTTASYSNSQLSFISLLQNNYCDLYFTSRIVAADGRQKFQVHSVSSSEFNIGSDYLIASFDISQQIRSTLIDDSILPWRNYRNVTNLAWLGETTFAYQSDATDALSNGYTNYMTFRNKKEINLRYYKKVDWLLGIIGGGCFLLFLVFWAVFSYISRALMKMDLAKALLLQKIGSDYPQNDKDLKIPEVGYNYLLPFSCFCCKKSHSEELIDEAERYNDIALLLKRIKVTHRNLNKLNLISESFETKVLRLNGEAIDEQTHSQFSVEQIERQNESNQAIDVHADVQNQVAHDVIVQEEDSQSQSSEEPKRRMIRVDELPPDSIRPPDSRAQLAMAPFINVNADGEQHLIVPGGNSQPIIILQGDNDPIIIPAQQPPAIVPNPLPQVPAEQYHPQPQPLHQVQDLTLIQNEQRDDKFGLTARELTWLQTQKAAKSLNSHATWLAMQDNKPEHFMDSMNLEQYDKWQGGYKARTKGLCSRFSASIASFFRTLDCFGAPVQLETYPHSSSIGFCLTWTIIALGVLTCALTLQNMNVSEFRVSQNYLDSSSDPLVRVTDNDFNCLVCFKDISYFISNSRSATFSFFQQNGDQRTTLNAVQMNSTDNTLNFQVNQYLLDTPIDTSKCFKLQNGQSVTMSANSYIGFTITPFCLGTVTFCNTSKTLTYNKYVAAMNANFISVILPGSRLNPQTGKLVNDFANVAYQGFNNILYRTNLLLEETVEVNSVMLLDDTTSPFLRLKPQIIDKNIRADSSMKRTILKGNITDTPSYSFSIRLSTAQTVYTITQKKADFILGVVGGVFLFWWALLHCLGQAYNRFIFRARLAKILYEQQGYDDCFPNRLLAAIHFPNKLLPSCIRGEIDRMKIVDARMKQILHHTSLVQYTDICYRLSTSFFTHIESKNLALIFFREKINEAEQVVIQEPVKQSKKEIIEKDFVQFEDEAIATKNNINIVHVQNEKDNVNDQINEKDPVADEQVEKLIPIIVEQQNEHVPHFKDNTFALDAFESKPTFSFKNQRKSTSVFGGCLSMIALTFLLLIANYEIGLYLTAAGRTVSYQSVIEEDAGIDLQTGVNFKMGLAFVNASSYQPLDVTSYLNNVGLGLVVQKYTRSNGVVTPNIQVINLVPCPTNYIQSWLEPNADLSYHAGLNRAYCVPDGLSLSISGTADSSMRSSFKLSIYNKLGNATGMASVVHLLNSSLVRFYWSSPQQNSVDRTENYYMQASILDYFGLTNTIVPTERNISLSKVNITYDDSISWQDTPSTRSSYRYDPFVSVYSEDFHYNGNPNTQAYYNLSFTYSKRTLVYRFSAPKFYEAFGITGGIIAALFFFLGWIALGFNRYRLKYLIGQQLYVFDKLKITQSKEKVKRVIRKTMNERHSLQRTNNYSQWDVLVAYLLSFIAAPISNYNFNNKLRRVTLVQQRVEKDMNLTEFYVSLYRARDAIDKKLLEEDPLKPGEPKVTDIYLKNIVNSNPQQYTNSRLLSYAKLHHLSCRDQMAAFQATNARINLKEVFDGNFLQRTFGVIDDNASVHLSMMRETMGSVSTSMLGSSLGSVGEPSENHD